MGIPASGPIFSARSSLVAKGRPNRRSASDIAVIVPDVKKATRLLARAAGMGFRAATAMERMYGSSCPQDTIAYPMPLAPGDKLGPYEILAPIGAGGMGDVYKARDTRLDRIVAVKVSKEQFTERFTREARAIAALNHPNVCHLYDVGPDYIVLEYVEGATLAGPLNLAEAMPVILQLIDGIEAAHDKNIIHRDLKPANIKITTDGVVKILDFGLAKAMDPPREESGTENSPTLTVSVTHAGMILGTVGFMSPEQAKGKTVDKRSDIWSFGVILYELLTGKRPFQGESATEILGAILHTEPDWNPVPARMRKLLQRCLQKDRKQRLAAIG